MQQDAWPSTHISLIVGLKDPQDSDAWRYFVENYRGPIVAYCCRRFQMQTASAEDIAQNVLLKLVRSIQGFQYDCNGSFRAWLRTITRNAVMDLLSKEGRRPDLGVGGSDDLFRLTDVRSEASFLAENLAERLRKDLVAEAEQAVRHRVRNSLNWEAYLRMKEGLSAREIAADLGVTVAATYKARSRILTMIRTEIAKMLKSE